MKWISISIIVGAFFFKIPQVVKIISSGSVEGISSYSYYAETIGFTNTAAYSMHLALPTSVYGETLVILVQNLAIIVLIWSKDKNIGMIEKTLFTIFMSSYLYVLFSGNVEVPEEAWTYISSSTILFNVCARVP